MAKEDDQDNKANRRNKTTMKVKYPFNKAEVTRSGHEIHYDDTEGKERLRWAHKDGSYTEITQGGKRVEFNVGHKQEYNKSGVTMTVDENNDVKVHGHQRINVSGGSHITVAGDADMAVGGSVHSVVAGNMKAAVNGDSYIGVNGNGNMNVKGNMSMKVSGNMTMETGGVHTIKASKISMNP
jgi:hypothetical protein